MGEGFSASATSDMCEPGLPQNISGCLLSAVINLVLVVGLEIVTSEDERNTNNGCEKRYAAISVQITHVQKRDYDIIENKLGLSATGAFSVAGHQQPFRDQQTKLRRMLDEADTVGCTAYQADARDWSTRPATSPEQT